MKVSKYDLDRANLCMRDAYMEKQRRKELNSKARRDILDGAKSRERFAEAAAKVTRIRDMSMVKEK